MPIEFSCPQCSRVLRVSDEHAGKTARCPDCQTIMNIPSAGEGAPAMDYSFGMESPMPAEQPTQSLPPKPAPGFGAGQAGYGGFQQAAAAQAPPKPTARHMQPRRATFDEIFNYGWKAFTDNVGLLVGVSVVVMGFGIMVGVIQAIIEGPPNQVPEPERMLMSSLIGIVGNLISMFLAIGQARINFDVARTSRAEFGRLFSGGDRFLPMLGASIIAGIALVGGLLLLIIPGIILMILYWSYFYFIADNKTTATGSFSAALEIGKLNIGTTLVLAIVSFLILLAGLLALGIGLLFAAPLVSMLWAVAYLKMTNQI